MKFYTYLAFAYALSFYQVVPMEAPLFKKTPKKTKKSKKKDRLFILGGASRDDFINNNERSELGFGEWVSSENSRKFDQDILKKKKEVKRFIVGGEPFIWSDNSHKLVPEEVLMEVPPLEEIPKETNLPNNQAKRILFQVEGEPLKWSEEYKGYVPDLKEPVSLQSKKTSTKGTSCNNDEETKLCAFPWKEHGGYVRSLKDVSCWDALGKRKKKKLLQNGVEEVVSWHLTQDCEVLLRRGQILGFDSHTIVFYPDGRFNINHRELLSKDEVSMLHHLEYYPEDLNYGYSWPDGLTRIEDEEIVLKFERFPRAYDYVLEKLKNETERITDTRTTYSDQTKYLLWKNIFASKYTKMKEKPLKYTPFDLTIVGKKLGAIKMAVGFDTALDYYQYRHLDKKTV